MRIMKGHPNLLDMLWRLVVDLTMSDVAGEVSLCGKESVCIAITPATSGPNDVCLSGPTFGNNAGASGANARPRRFTTAFFALACPRESSIRRCRPSTIDSPSTCLPSGGFDIYRLGD